jgi:sugar/nucleoside kinase (ribokinase family)
LGNAVITGAARGDGWFDLDAQITLTPAQAALFATGMDVFWGTGDCANGAFLAQLSALPMPEPCSFAVLVSGLFYVAVRRAASAPSHRFGIKRVARGADRADKVKLAIPVD